MDQINQLKNKIDFHKARFEAIAQTASDSIVISDEDSVIVFANKKTYDIFGYPEGTLIGSDLEVLMPERYRKRHRIGVQSFKDTGKTKLIGHTVEFEGLRKDGSTFPLELSLSCWKEEDSYFFSAIIRDITERKEASIKLQNQKKELEATNNGLKAAKEELQKTNHELEKLSLVARRTINGVVIFDAEGLVEWVNEGFTKLTCYTFSEIVGRFPSSVLAGEETDKATVNRIKESLKKDKSFTEEILIYKKSGEKAWLLLDFTPILDDTGEVKNFIALKTDITERKEAEASRLQFTKDLYVQNRDLQQFTYIVSHNLRSPIATAKGLIDLLAATDKGSKDFDISLDYLKQSINKMDTILKDLSTILSIRDRKGSIDKEMVKLAPIFQQVIEEQREQLKKCGGEVSLNIEENTSVHGNKAYLYSIFYNLLSNAIKYRSPKRALEVKIKCYSSKDRDTIITFSDNGLGFDMNLAGDKVFQLYKRFHSNSDGRGMGLFLVKTHLEAMGGHIEVSSQVNVGTKFLIGLK
jgi:PAS domain S-box-containing protein